MAIDCRFSGREGTFFLPDRSNSSHKEVILFAAGSQNNRRLKLTDLPARILSRGSDEAIALGHASKPSYRRYPYHGGIGRLDFHLRDRLYDLQSVGCYLLNRPSGRHTYGVLMKSLVLGVACSSDSFII